MFINYQVGYHLQLGIIEKLLLKLYDPKKEVNRVNKKFRKIKCMSQIKC